MVDKWKGKKVAVYLRRSKGEKGDTKAQLEAILPKIEALEKAGRIRKVNRNIVGRSLEKGGPRFNPQRDLAKKGDIFNEGNGQSAFGTAKTRAVFTELLKRVHAGEYDAVIASDLTRYSRDPLDFARAGRGFDAVDMWREDGKEFWGLQDNRGYGTLEPQNESIITTLLMWGGEGKKTEVAKAIGRLDAKLARGFIQAKLKAQLAGSGSKGAGTDYRRLWAMMQAYGDSPRGGLKGRAAIAREFKLDETGTGRLYVTFKEWDSVKLANGRSALENWLDVVEAINAFIERQPGTYIGPKFKSKPVTNLLKASNGFINYPAGVQPSPKYDESSKFFVTFPNPLDFDFDELAATEDAQSVEGWGVTFVPVEEVGPLLTSQTMARAAQRRAAKERKKRAVR